MLLAFATAALIMFSGDAQQEPTRLEDVTVTAEAGRHAARVRVESFVQQATRSPRGRPLARWDAPVCISAVNFQPQFSQALIDRVARRMLEAGLDIKETGCKPDLMIIGSDDGQGLARRMVADFAQGFRPSRANTDLGSAALRAFQESDAPIRWWHVSIPVVSDTGEVAIRLDGEDAPQVRVRDASRLRSNIRDKMHRVVIIIEPGRLTGVRGTALADYVAFISMAQVDPVTRMEGFPTILNLLDDPAGYDSMTEWDQDFLAGLYDVAQPRVTSEQQRGDIAAAVLRRRDAVANYDAQPVPQD